MAVTVQVYKSRNPLARQPWRWRAVAANGRRLANGGEAYTNLEDLRRALRLLFDSTVTVYGTSGDTQ